ncbi:hypothetical protein FHS35_001916 [Streptomyces umbrinus]|uniref:hypothetical protein n=1 Tax=Streptomyces umbrinus TaxID=67370 RepID=UPI00167D8156|nr:hypothetical protein [Streptomyces umbrinus]MCR3725068.1 hypothetical protein [Streptomyces umbrinus]GHH62692.1 hypothetical protein GCM10018775_79270 [Streptomyces umbrinus]
MKELAASCAYVGVRVRPRAGRAPLRIVRLRNTGTGRLRRTLVEDADPVLSMAFGADGRNLTPQELAMYLPDQTARATCPG